MAGGPHRTASGVHVSQTLISLFLAGGLAAVHLFAAARLSTGGAPKKRWLSAAGGASVAYVFLHLMPELAAAHAREGVTSEVFYFALALAGLVVFYGVEHEVRQRSRTASAATGSPRAFMLHVASFTAYNLVVGYLLMRRDHASDMALLLYGGAMGLHFLSSDYTMRLDHKHAYVARTRWILAAAVMLGWLGGWLLEVPRAAVDGLFALLAGGIVLNVLKEELPEEKQSNFGAFFLGALGYGALLMALA
jgi:hypothetical protein